MVKQKYSFCKTVFVQSKQVGIFLKVKFKLYKLGIANFGCF